MSRIRASTTRACIIFRAEHSRNGAVVVGLAEGLLEAGWGLSRATREHGHGKPVVAGGLAGALESRARAGWGLAFGDFRD